LFPGKELNTTEVQVDTLDYIISEQNLDRIDMMKIDVEGFEYEVLTGCINSLKSHKIQNIVCEIHHAFLQNRGMNEQIIYDLLKNYDYAIKFIDDSHIIAQKLD